MQSTSPIRILSIDVFRGITMFLLVGEFTGLFSLMTDDSLDGSLISMIGYNFHHHPWNGLRFWDLVQPYFMFIVGLSLPYAVLSRQNKGDDSKTIFRHVLKRSAILLLLGWGLYCIGPGRITFQFQNVLAQISVTYLIAFLIMNKSVKFQIVVSLGLLLVTELVYRFFPVEGFNNAFVINENFGTWLDTQYGGQSGGGWVSINAIPTAAHTIWGVLVAKLLMRDIEATEKLKQMIIVGVGLLVVGFSMDPLTPIIKRIATTSFTFASGGLTILTLALFYWIIDIKKFNGSWTKFFSIVGMNSLFIYLFAHLKGASFIEAILHPFSYALFGWTGELNVAIITAILVWAALWGICWWMYKKKLFIKI